jgi:hypothetical protein
MTRTGYEVDFLAEDTQGSRELIQVCADLEPSATRQRELRALEEGMKETGCGNATVVTLRDEGSAEVGGRQVRIVPAWRWLLEQPSLGLMTDIENPILDARGALAGKTSLTRALLKERRQERTREGR